MEDPSARTFRTESPGPVVPGSRFWLCLLFLLGDGSLVLTGCGPSDPADLDTEDRLAFTEIAREAGLGEFRHHTGARGDRWMPETMGSGVGVLDYDGDGHLDVVLVGGGYWGEEAPEDYRVLWLYRNQGDGTFELRTEEAGLGDVRAYGFGVAASDVDEDGDTDLFLTTLGRNRLFENRDGRFVEVTAESGLGEGERWSTSATFFDADRDGFLDLYVGNYVHWSPENDLRCTNEAGEKTYCTPILYDGVPGRFYRNDGDGTFTDRTEEAGFLPAPGKTLGAVTVDVDRNRLPDLAVANDMDRNLLYVNRGDGRFEERGMSAGVAFDRNGRARSGMGIAAGTVDSTDRLSIFVGNFSDETIGVFRHQGGGLFEERSSATRIGPRSRPTLTFGLLLFDPDLDGHRDLFAANGHIRPGVGEESDRITYRQPPHLFVNRGDGTYVDRAGDLFDRAMVARGAAYGDLDGDGDQDLLVTENGGGVHLWRNETGAEGVLRIRLRGRTSNRDGLGTRVEATVGDRLLIRRLHTGASYLSQSETVLTFGLGARRRADSLVVHWPSGTTDRLGALDGGQSVRIVEGRGVADRSPL